MNAEEEDREGLLARHRKEAREHENKVRFMLKQAKKQKKAEVEAEIKALESALKQRHEEELAAFAALAIIKSESEGAEDDEKAGIDESVSQTQGELSDEGTEVKDVAQSKRDKAKRKKERKADKELERQKIKADILENAGPSNRDLELQDLNRKLSAENLEVAEISADGNCLYRAVAHQLQLQAVDLGTAVFSFGTLRHGVGASELTFSHLREVAADHMRRHRDDFEPFLNVNDCESGGESFEDYCAQVASSTAAVWGGQLELRALSAALGRPIWVYDALQPTVRMGEMDGEPIRLAFHRHFYSLGEHYNSIVMKNKPS